MCLKLAVAAMAPTKKVVKPDEVPEGEQMFTHSGIPSSINALHLTGMEDDLKTIFEHAMFEDIVNVNPIPFTLSSSANSCDAQQLGHKACFKQAEYNFTMSEEGPGMYDAACNFSGLTLAGTRSMVFPSTLQS